MRVLAIYRNYGSTLKLLIKYFNFYLKSQVTKEVIRISHLYPLQIGGHKKWK